MKFKRGDILNWIYEPDDMPIGEFVKYEGHKVYIKLFELGKGYVIDQTGFAPFVTNRPENAFEIDKKYMKKLRWNKEIKDIINE